MGTERVKRRERMNGKTGLCIRKEKEYTIRYNYNKQIVA